MAAKTTQAAKTPKSDFPKTSAPARRALEAAGIYTLKQLSKKTKADVAALHGMGPQALGILTAAMAEKGLAFAAPKKKKA